MYSAKKCINFRLRLAPFQPSAWLVPLAGTEWRSSHSTMHKSSADFWLIDWRPRWKAAKAKILLQSFSGIAHFDFSKVTIWQRNFSGKMKSFVKCTEVKFESSRIETFYDLQLNVQSKTVGAMEKKKRFDCKIFCLICFNEIISSKKYRLTPSQSGHWRFRIYTVDEK